MKRFIFIKKCFLLPLFFFFGGIFGALLLILDGVIKIVEKSRHVIEAIWGVLATNMLKYGGGR
jgi:hypothetical protein